MFSLGWSEITIIVVLLIVIVGPNEIPNLLKHLGNLSKKLKSISREFNTTLNNLAKESEIDQIKKDIKNEVIENSKITSIKSDIDQIRKDIKNEVIENSKITSIKSDFDDINSSFDKLNKEVKNIKDNKIDE